MRLVSLALTLSIGLAAQASDLARYYQGEELQRYQSDPAAREALSYRLSEVSANLQSWWEQSAGEDKAFVNECDSNATVVFSQDPSGHWHINDHLFIESAEVRSVFIEFTVKKLDLSQPAGADDREVFYAVSPDAQGRERWTTDRPEFFAPITQKPGDCKYIRFVEIAQAARGL